MKRFIASLFAFSIAFPLLANAATLTVGIAPQRSTAELARLWSPILAYASKKADIKLKFATAPDAKTFKKRLAEGRYDIAYMDPYQYTIASQTPGYVAFAREHAKKGRGVVVVHKDSPIKSLAELGGQNLAFPSRSAFSESVMPRAMLAEENIAYNSEFGSSQDSIYLCVSHGIFAAGGGDLETLDNISPNIRKNLRVLWSSEGDMPYAIAAHPRTPADTVRKIQQILVGMTDDPNAKSLLDAMDFDGIQTASNDDWEVVHGKAGLLNELAN